MSEYFDRQNALFSSDRQDWETPHDFFAGLHREFCFTVDAAAAPNNAKLPRFFTEADDGLAQDWRGERVWINPPFGKGGVEKWIRAAHQKVRDGAEIAVLLVPARTDTKWFHEVAQPHAEIRFIKGRLRFVGAKDKAPFPVCVVIFRRAS